MPINSPSTKDFTRPEIPSLAVTVETTHLTFNFDEGAGYMRQVFKDSDDNQIGVRFLKIEGAKYSNVEASILTKVQKVADDIELDSALIDGVTITEIDRAERIDGMMK